MDAGKMGQLAQQGRSSRAWPKQRLELDLQYRSNLNCQAAPQSYLPLLPVFYVLYRNIVSCCY